MLQNRTGRGTVVQPNYSGLRSAGGSNTVGSPVFQNSSILGDVEWMTPTGPISLMPRSPSRSTTFPQPVQKIPFGLVEEC